MVIYYGEFLDNIIKSYLNEIKGDRKPQPYYEYKKLILHVETLVRPNMLLRDSFDLSKIRTKEEGITIAKSYGRMLALTVDRENEIRGERFSLSNYNDEPIG